MLSCPFPACGLLRPQGPLPRGPCPPLCRTGPTGFALSGRLVCDAPCAPLVFFVSLPHLPPPPGKLSSPQTCPRVMSDRRGHPRCFQKVLSNQSCQVTISRRRGRLIRGPHCEGGRGGSPPGKKLSPTEVVRGVLATEMVTPRSFQVKTSRRRGGLGRGPHCGRSDRGLVPFQRVNGSRLIEKQVGGGLAPFFFQPLFVASTPHTAPPDVSQREKVHPLLSY